MKRKFFLVLALLTCLVGYAHVQQPENKAQVLDARQKSIVVIAALTAKGDLAPLQTALNEGLDAGLTINEISEVLVHLYAYCGFPRSIQGLNTFMSVLESRKSRGIIDKPGKEVNPVNSNHSKYEQGRRTLETLTAQPQSTPKTGYGAFSPVIDTFLKEHLFADIFRRDILTYTEREIATISALISLGGVEPMIQSHMRIGLNLGMTTSALAEIVSLIEIKIGKMEADAGRRVLAMIMSPNNASQNNEGRVNEPALFARGQRAPAANFTGVVWVNMLLQPKDRFDCSLGVVIFEPGSRTNWHRHPGGQVLLVTEGIGYYQEKGGKIQLITKGDIVKCQPGIEHWHGASPGAALTHIAIGPDAEKGNAVWLQRVTDEEYKRFK